MSSPGWDRQTLPPVPNAWIQWKGTNACLTIKCACGGRTHFDDSFLYYVRCSECGKVYMCNGHIELIPLTDEETEYLTDSQIKLGEEC
jgi:hypothetical protein